MYSHATRAKQQLRRTRRPFLSLVLVELRDTKDQVHDYYSLQPSVAVFRHHTMGIHCALALYQKEDLTVQRNWPVSRGPSQGKILTATLEVPDSHQCMDRTTPGPLDTRRGSSQIHQTAPLVDPTSVVLTNVVGDQTVSLSWRSAVVDMMSRLLEPSSPSSSSMSRYCLRVICL